MKVYHYVEYPLAWAPGGHAIQINKTINSLGNLGVQNFWFHFEEKYNDIDILHFWSTPNKMFVELAKERNIKIVLSTMFGKPIIDKRKQLIFKTIIKFINQIKLHPRINYSFFNVYKYFDAIIVLNEFEKEHLKNIWDIKESKIHVVPNGVDEIYIENSKDVNPIIFDGLIFVGFINEVKNVLELIKACKNNGIKLKIIGEFRYCNKTYKKLIMDEIDNHNVFWLGPIYDKKKLIAHIKGSKGLVLPSKWESYPLVVLEALAIGQDVLLVDKEHLRSIFKECVYYCNPESEAFNIQIKEFYERTQSLKNQNCQVYSWKEIGKQIINIYKKIL